MLKNLKIKNIIIKSNRIEISFRFITLNIVITIKEIDIWNKIETIILIGLNDILSIK